MRHISFISISLLAVLFSTSLISCSEEYSSPLKGQTVSEQVFETGTTTKTIIIGKSDLSKCTITSSAEWCKAFIQGSSVTISLLPNETYDDRQAIIMLTDPEDGTTLSFLVVQKQINAILVDKTTIYVSDEGGTYTINVESNVEYEVELPEGGWITIVNKTRGLQKRELVLKMAKNNSNSEREGIVSIVDKKSGAKADVIIRQDFKPIIDLDIYGGIITDEYGTERTIRVKSNVLVTVYSDDNWVEISDKFEVSGFNFAVKIRVLPMFSNTNTRMTMVHFSFKGKWQSYGCSFNVTQMVLEKLSVDKTEIEVDYKGGTAYLTLNANTEFSISAPSWANIYELSKKQINMSDVYEYSYKVVIDKNSSEDERNGNIIFKSKSKEVAVRVNQSGKPKNPDDGGDNYESLIIGKWKLKNNDNYYTTIATHVEFKGDGTFSWTSTNNSYYEEHGVYKIDGDILYMLFSDEDDWGMSQIILLNSMSLIYKNIKDNGELSKTAYSFQRVN